MRTAFALRMNGVRTASSLRVRSNRRLPNSPRSNGIRTLPEAQAVFEDWVPATGPLGELTAASVRRVDALRASVAELERLAEECGPVASFRDALRAPTVQIIAEIKRQSPSKGVINASIGVEERARAYVAGGAAAVSVLTEPVRFGGSLSDLRNAHAVVSAPLLRKDFIVDRLQLLEARIAGASAVLLIARALAPEHFARLADEAVAIGLDVLLEVRTERELDRALRFDRGVIGINNRNLETLAIDDIVSERLLPLVPAERVAVYESGITCRSDVERAGAMGASAVLVGSSLSISNDGVAAVHVLTGVVRSSRG
jgi:indole-3-glycerol phosphate synthase